MRYTRHTTVRQPGAGAACQATLSPGARRGCEAGTRDDGAICRHTTGSSPPRERSSTSSNGFSGLRRRRSLFPAGRDRPVISPVLFCCRRRARPGRGRQQGPHPDGHGLRAHGHLAHLLLRLPRQPAVLENPLALIALPVVVAVVAHLGRLSRWYVPCRTAALVLVWPVLVVAILHEPAEHRHISPLVGVIAAWLLALVALGWRLAKGVHQDDRMYGLDSAGQGRRPGAPGQPGPRGRAEGREPRRPLRRPGPPRRPRLRRPGPGRGAALRRARRARPPGRRAAAPAADLGRGRHGRAGRDDRAGPGQGAGPLDRRVHRGRPAAGHRRRHHRQADAALRLPRPAGHRQDHRGPGAGQDLLRLRPARDARGGRGAPGRPGRRVPGRDRDQDQRAGGLRVRPGAVHRRGLQPGQRGRRPGRPVRHRGGPDAAQAGRGQPRGPDHHPGRVREADGGLPGLQPRPGLPVRHPAEVPELLPGGAAGAGRGGAGPPRRAARPGRAAGAVADVRGGRPAPDRR